MKTFLITLVTIALAAVLVAGGVWLGVTWVQGQWGYNRTAPAAIDSRLGGAPCSEGWQGYGMPGPGMMGRGWQDMPCDGAYTAQGDAAIASLEEVQEVVESYVSRLGYIDLHVTEVMEFERNYYAIVAEEDTGIGAMELLVDNSGAVGPEPGPNMMWNAKYGMHHGGRMGMMGDYTDGEMTLSPGEAQDVAQRWLDAYRPNRKAGEADPFYGYYTLHFLNDDGQIEGMLSVHGSTGDVWYHSWHGDFVAMTEDHGHE